MSQPYIVKVLPGLWPLCIALLSALLPLFNSISSLRPAKTVLKVQYFIMSLRSLLKMSWITSILDKRIPFLKQPPPPASGPTEPAGEKSTIAPADTLANSIPAPPRLVKFQTLVGICSPNVLRVNPTLKRPAQNEGIYKRKVDEETRTKFQYHLSNYMVNAFFLLQIIFGAALTALGAAGGPSSAVTFLGAMNTIVAGLLTYLKGQGLPMRLDQYLHLLRTLREHIEERERNFMEPECALDVDEEIQNVTKMYQEVRQTAQDNAPGTVLPPRGTITTLLKKPDIDRNDVSALGGDKILNTGLQDLANLRHRGEATVEKTESLFQNAKEGMKGVEREVEHLGGIAKDTIRRLSGEFRRGKLPHEKMELEAHGNS